jgi:hypothetical protein
MLDEGGEVFCDFQKGATRVPVWNVATGEVQLTIQSDLNATIASLALGTTLSSQDALKRGKSRKKLHRKTQSVTAVIGDSSGGVAMWNIDSGEVVWHKEKAHPKRVTAALVDGANHAIFTASSDGTLHQWDINSGKSLLSWHDAAAATTGAPTALGLACASRGPAQVLVASSSIRLFSPGTMGGSGSGGSDISSAGAGAGAGGKKGKGGVSPTLTLLGHGGGTNALCLLSQPPGKDSSPLLQQCCVSASAVERQVYAWSLQTGQCTHTLRLPEVPLAQDPLSLQVADATSLWCAVATVRDEVCLFRLSLDDDSSLLATTSRKRNSRNRTEAEPVGKGGSAIHPATVVLEPVSVIRLSPFLSGHAMRACKLMDARNLLLVLWDARQQAAFAQVPLEEEDEREKEREKANEKGRGGKDKDRQKEKEKEKEKEKGGVKVIGSEHIRYRTGSGTLQDPSQPSAALHVGTGQGKEGVAFVHRLSASATQPGQAGKVTVSGVEENDNGGGGGVDKSQSVLQTALRSGDTSLLSTVLAQGQCSAVIELPSPLVLTLLGTLIDMLERRPRRAPQLLPWIRALLQGRPSECMQPAGLPLLQQARALCADRLAVHAPLAALAGRLHCVEGTLQAQNAPSQAGGESSSLMVMDERDLWVDDVLHQDDDSSDGEDDEEDDEDEENDHEEEEEDGSDYPLGMDSDGSDDD